jgi:hypothetical protein
MSRIPAPVFVKWQEFARLEAERVEREYKQNGKPKEPETDMMALRSVLHNKPGK